MVKKKDPIFELALWNCYQREMTGLPLTTNGIEAWHRGFNSLVQANKPTTWKLIDALRKDNVLSIVKREQLNSGLDSAGNVTRNERHVNIVRVLKKFSVMEPLEFLKAIAVHLVM